MSSVEDHGAADNGAPPRREALLPASSRWPYHWGIPARSAATSATVVAVTFAVAAVGLLAVLYHSLISGVDNLAVARVSNIARALMTHDSRELDASLLRTDHRLTAIQIIGPDGDLVRGSDGAPGTPLITPGELSNSTQTRALANPAGHIARISARIVETENGSYTVIVGSDVDTVTSAVRRVQYLLIGATGMIALVAAAASYLFVQRSLRSVEAMRARVADISVTDLGERVPVPPSRDEIHALAITMNGMLTRIESSYTARQRFVGDASQALSEPLGTILSALEEVEAQPSSLNRDLMLSTLLPQAHRMKALVEDLLLLARADERGLTQRRQVTVLTGHVSSEADRLRHLHPIVVRATSDDTEIVVDTAALTTVLRNLFDYAARRTRSRVDASARVVASQLIITVSDDGPGIPPADRARLFERFARLSTAAPFHDTGLGLAIVAEMVAAQHGSVTIDESDSGGMEVTVSIPLGQ